MPATMMIGGRVYVVSDEIAQEAVQERIDRADSLIPNRHFDENRRAAETMLTEADAIAIQLEPKSEELLPKVTTSRPADGGSTSEARIRHVAEWANRDLRLKRPLKVEFKTLDVPGQVVSDRPDVLEFDYRNLEHSLDYAATVALHEAYHAAECQRGNASGNHEEAARRYAKQAWPRCKRELFS